MKLKELMAAAKELQIDPGFYSFSRSDAVYSIARSKGKWEICYLDWHGPVVQAVYDTEDAACEAFYRILKDEEARVRDSKNERPNREASRTIVRIVCPHPERMELYFEDCAVLIPGTSGSICYFAEPRRMEWLAPPEKAGQRLTEDEREEILALEPVLRADKDKRIVFLYDGELYRAAAALADAVHEKRLRFWIARRRLRKAFSELPKGIPDSVLGRAYFDTR